MTITELREQLQNLEEDGHGNKELVLAIQPSYPLAVSFEGIVDPLDLADVREDEGDGDDDEEDGAASEYIWMVAGSHAPHDLNPYASRDLWEAV